MSWVEEDNEEDEFENDESRDQVQLLNDNIIFLIDARTNMHIRNPNSSHVTSFLIALKVALQVMKNKIIFNAKHMVGIVFFGAFEKVDISCGINDVWVFLPLQVPNARAIHLVEKLIIEVGTGNLDFEEFHKALSKNDICPIRGGIKCCSLMFHDNKLGHFTDLNRIFILTNQDNPRLGHHEASSTEEHHRLLQVAHDAAESGICIEVYAIDASEDDKNISFDMNKFYRELEEICNNRKCIHPQNAARSLEELVARMQKKEFRARLTKLAFQISPNLTIDVQVFKLVQHVKKPASVWIDARTNKLIKTESECLAVDSSTLIKREDAKTYIEFGGSRVHITRDEMASMKKLCDPGIVLLGFKLIGNFTEDCMLTSPYFIYPDEARVNGSELVFASLLTCMLEKRVMGLCRFTRNVSSSPQFCLLVAQSEVRNKESNFQEFPAGMHLIILPFEEDVRRLDIDIEYHTEQKQVAVASEMLSSVELEGMNCRSFANPALQLHYSALQAIALKQSKVEWNPDTDNALNVDHEMIKRAAGPHCTLLKDACGFIDVKKELKIKHEDSIEVEEHEPRKKIKHNVKPEDLDVDWDSIDTYTVVQLKVFLKLLGLSSSGKKSDLIDRLRSTLS